MKRHPDALMIFAAGHGKRMRPLTDDRPKPLIEVARRPLIDHALDARGTQRPARTVVNTHAHAEQMARAALDRGFLIAHEPDLLETGGGLKAAAPLLQSDTVFTLNADAIWTGQAPLDALMAAWDPDRMDALLHLVPTGAARAHAGSGDFGMDQAGRLSRGSDFVYTGAQILKLEPVLDRPESAFSLNLVWNDIGEIGRLYGVVHSGGWCDVGHPDAIELAEALLDSSDV